MILLSVSGTNLDSTSGKDTATSCFRMFHNLLFTKSTPFSRETSAIALNNLQIEIDMIDRKYFEEVQIILNHSKRTGFSTRTCKEQIQLRKVSIGIFFLHAYYLFCASIRMVKTKMLRQPRHVYRTEETRNIC